MVISLNLQAQTSALTDSKSTDLHGRSDPKPPHIPASILTGIEETLVDYLGPKKIIQGGSMDLHENDGTVSCINSCSSEKWNIDSSGCFLK